MKKVCILGPDGCGKSTIIPIVLAQLRSNGISAAHVVTTRAIEEYPITKEYRARLVAADTSSGDRFHCALHLYQFAVEHYVRNNPLPEVLLLERGASSMISYNFVPGWPEWYQIQQIPKVDLAIYIDAPFEDLTRRLHLRQTTDFQDTDLEFRLHVHKKGVEDFHKVCAQHGSKGVVIDNPDNKSLNDVVKEIYDAITR